MQLIDLVIHKLRINTYWEDYYRFGFYRRDKSWDERALYLGQHCSKYWPWEGNSRRFDALFIRKSLQKSIATAHGLPAPKTFMKVGKYYPIQEEETFEAALSEVTVPFILKIDGGMRGMAIHLFEPDSGGYLYNGERVSASWIWQKFERQLDPGYIVEARVRNHQALDDIYTGSLNTVRLVTVRTRDGKLELLRPFIKFGRGGSYVDNLKAGGLMAPIGEDHRLGIGVDELGNRFANHPDSGNPIEGAQVPYCREAFELALEASRVFGFMATLGWDIGITPDGPVIIEGNTRWGATAYQEQIGPYLNAEVAAGLMPRYWWTPWDKTHIFPRHLDKVHGGWWQKRLARRRQRWSG